MDQLLSPPSLCLCGAVTALTPSQDPCQEGGDSWVPTWCAALNGTSQLELPGSHSRQLGSPEHFCPSVACTAGLVACPSPLHDCIWGPSTPAQSSSDSIDSTGQSVPVFSLLCLCSWSLPSSAPCWSLPDSHRVTPWALWLGVRACVQDCECEEGCEECVCEWGVCVRTFLHIRVHEWMCECACLLMYVHVGLCVRIIPSCL